METQRERKRQSKREGVAALQLHQVFPLTVTSRTQTAILVKTLTRGISRKVPSCEINDKYICFSLFTFVCCQEFIILE